MRKASLGVIFLTVFLDLIGFGIVIPLLPRYAETLLAGDPQKGLKIGLLLASFSLMQFLCNPVWGRLQWSGSGGPRSGPGRPTSATSPRRTKGRRAWD